MKDNLRKNRLGVSVFFFINGFLYANLMARIPLLKDLLAVSNSQLGILLFCIALGALSGMPLAGKLAIQFGSKNIAYLTGLAFCIIMGLVPLPGTFLVTGLLLYLVGLSAGAMDVCINAQAIMVERLYGRSIMSSFHGLFSIGMFAGAITASLFSKLEVGLLTHMMVVSFPLLVVVWYGKNQMLPDEYASEATSGKRAAFSPVVLALGGIAFCSFTTEGSMVAWSALYMTEFLGQSKAMGGIAFGMFSGGMTVGRIFGDWFITRFGGQKIIFTNVLIALTGFGLAIGIADPWSTFAGFLLVGLGASTVVPIVFTAVGNLPGVPPSAGIATATTIGYLGLFLGPPTIGFLSDASNLRMALLFPVGLLVLLWFLAKFVFAQISTANRN
jgi:MFS family permease